MAQYNVSQVCLNGHIRNDTIHLHPEANEEYCARCGEKTITQCLGVDDAEVAGKLFILLNLITDYMISMPGKVDAMFSGLPDSAKEQIEKRDSK